MIKIFVHADDTNGEPFIADHYEFETVPRIGEHVILDNRGSDVVLRVVAINNHARPKGDVMNPVSYVELMCKVVG